MFLDMRGIHWQSLSVWQCLFGAHPVPPYEQADRKEKEGHEIIDPDRTAFDMIRCGQFRYPLVPKLLRLLWLYYLTSFRKRLFRQLIIEMPPLIRFPENVLEFFVSERKQVVVSIYLIQ
jgi:hypothetical protein